MTIRYLPDRLTGFHRIEHTQAVLHTTQPWQTREANEQINAQSAASKLNKITKECTQPLPPRREAFTAGTRKTWTNQRESYDAFSPLPSLFQSLIRTVHSIVLFDTFYCIAAIVIVQIDSVVG